jgi:LmbE family N-acetylglucosaminyl deacetylase
MPEPLRLMCILAHPDDESLGLGGTLAKYAAEGVELSLLTATRGQRGWKGEPDDDPGPEALGAERTGELEAAAQVLGVRRLWVLDHLDGALDRVDARDIVPQLAQRIREAAPHVVVTFGPDGVYGHPDHIAISQFASAAVVLAAAPDERLDGVPHTVSKLYFLAVRRDVLEAYQRAFGAFGKEVDGVVRRAAAWEDWAVTTRIDARAFGAVVWEAIGCHRTQFGEYRKLERLTGDDWLTAFGEQTFYRAFSLVDVGREVEDDVFMGLRPAS